MGQAWVLHLALVTAGPAAQPQPPRVPAVVELDWNAPQGCGSGEQVLARMRELLSGPPAGDGIAYVAADIVVTTAGVHMTLTTVFDGHTDQREVESGTCATLAEATAVLLAVSLEPGPTPESVPDSKVAPSVPHVPEPAADSEPELEPPPRVPVILEDRDDPSAVHVASVRKSTTPRRASTRGLRAFVTGSAGPEWGALDGFSGAGRLGVGFRTSRWNAQIHGTYVLPRRRPGGLYQLGTAGARGCWTPGSGSWRPQLCGGGEIGGLRVDTREIDPADTVLGPYAGPAVGGGVVVRRGGLEWTLGAEVVGRAWGSRTRLPGPEVLTEQRPVSLRLMTGIRFSFSPPG